jgi:hypothetical protein
MAGERAADYAGILAAPPQHARDACAIRMLARIRYPRAQPPPLAACP